MIRLNKLDKERAAFQGGELAPKEKRKDYEPEAIPLVIKAKQIKPPAKDKEPPKIGET